MNLNLKQQTKYIFFTVSLSYHQTSSLRKFYKINGTLLGGKDSFPSMWIAGSKAVPPWARTARLCYKTLMRAAR
jgi:hypothetical protein